MVGGPERSTFSLVARMTVAHAWYLLLGSGNAHDGGAVLVVRWARLRVLDLDVLYVQASQDLGGSLLEEEVDPFDPGWSALAERDGAKTWAHIHRCFRRHRDRKYTVGPDGRVVRRSFLVGLGNEGTKLAARRKLGAIVGGTPLVFVGWKRHLLRMGRAEARRLGLPGPP